MQGFIQKISLTTVEKSSTLYFFPENILDPPLKNQNSSDLGHFKQKILKNAFFPFLKKNIFFLIVTPLFYRLSLLMKTFEQIKENGEQNQNVYNIFKVWRTNSK